MLFRITRDRTMSHSEMFRVTYVIAKNWFMVHGSDQIQN